MVVLHNPLIRPAISWGWGLMPWHAFWGPSDFHESDLIINPQTFGMKQSFEESKATHLTDLTDKTDGSDFTVFQKSTNRWESRLVATNIYIYVCVCFEKTFLDVWPHKKFLRLHVLPCHLGILFHQYSTFFIQNQIGGHFGRILLNHGVSWIRVTPTQQGRISSSTLFLLFTAHCRGVIDITHAIIGIPNKKG